MISLTHVSKQYGGQILFIEADLQINAGEKIGLVGPNGSGKTTIFRMITGEEEPDEGEVSRPKRVTIGYFRQDVGDLRGRSVLAETIAGAGEVAEVGEQLALTERRMTEGDVSEALLERYGSLQERFESLGGYELEARAQTVLAGLGFGPEQISGDVGKQSGGWKMRVALARILLGRPEVLLLDEPTNYLDIESILWLEGFLRDYPGAVLMTCHDRDVMNRVVTRIVEIDGGEVKTYTGDYDFYERARALDATRREAEYDRQQAMLAKEMRFIDRFKAQAAKAAQVQSRVKKLDKIERVEPPRQIIEKNFDFRQPSRSGEDVVKVVGLRKVYGSRVVHDGLDLVVRRAERWAVMGENGAGKTTLLKMMVGEVAPDGGTVGTGAGVSVGYFAQHQMEQLTGSWTILEELQAHTRTAGIGVLRGAAGAFGFHGDDIDKKIEVLSGGEKARLALLKILFDAPNLLVLDEPTNHLDLITKRMLVRTLESYEGTIVFVSHDRAFLRAIANHVLELTS
ncbi:MAG: ABC-F family ATP-binding cassette domain-containing protein, partial [Myxococcales bacterium]|nr:ABC-F family ATP-binding cassette domain-containing protein [Myxococcales bacterium]